LAFGGAKVKKRAYGSPMKRDMDLIRRLLFAIEEAPPQGPTALEVPGFTGDEINHNLALLLEAGLIVGRQSGELGRPTPHIRVLRLTWEGHDFLDAARDETRWKQARSLIVEKGGAFAFDVVKQLLLELLKQSIGIPN
jgi:hypothetical protein